MAKISIEECLISYYENNDFDDYDYFEFVESTLRNLFQRKDPRNMYGPISTDIEAFNSSRNIVCAKTIGVDAYSLVMKRGRINAEIHNLRTKLISVTEDEERLKSQIQEKELELKEVLK